MHIPDRWGYLIFSDKKVSESPIQYQLPSIETAKDGFGLDMTLNKLFMEKIKHTPLTLVS
jgi:hypothetical protein